MELEREGRTRLDNAMGPSFVRTQADIGRMVAELERLQAAMAVREPADVEYLPGKPRTREERRDRQIRICWQMGWSQLGRMIRQAGEIRNKLALKRERKRAEEAGDAVVVSQPQQSQQQPQSLARGVSTVPCNRNISTFPHRDRLVQPLGLQKK